jgi:FG-GAP-like repeat
MKGLQPTIIMLLPGFLLTGFLACAPAHGQETPLQFQGNLFDPFPTGFFPTMFRTRDLDGDGFVDLVVAGRDPDHRLVTRRGLGNGRFVDIQILEALGFTDWLELADLDGDGKEDIVTAWRGDAPELICYRGLGGGLFAGATILADVVFEGVGRDPQSVAIADFDGDKDLDIAVSNYIGQSIDIFSSGVSAGEFTFERTARIRLATYFGGVAYPRIVTAADMDGDGDSDLVVNEMGGGRIAFIRNEGGRFVRPRETRVPQIGTERPGIAGQEIVDADGDGDLDVVCPALLLESTQKIVCFVNDGTGAFTARLVGESSALGYVFCTHLADLDSDGDLDAISGAAIPGTIAIGRRTASGPFAFEIDLSYQFGQLVRHLDAVDVDGDCDLDIVGIDGPGQLVFVRRNITPQQGSCGGGFAALAGAGAGPAALVEPTVAGPAGGRGSIPRFDRNGDGVFTAEDAVIWLAELSRTKPEVERETGPKIAPVRGAKGVDP